jgi:hypothetical protein
MLLTKVLILEKMIRLPFAIGRRCSSPLLRQGAFMQTMIHPEFTPGDLDGNASELCGLFMIREKDVPVESYTIVADAIERGIEVGINRAYKHSDETLSASQRAQIVDHVARATMEMLDEVIDWGDGYDD